MKHCTKQKIAEEVIKTLVGRFESFPENSSSNRNAPFHEAFLQAFDDKLAGKISDRPFLISLSSWLHGLSTTLGQQFFEKVAHALCNGTKKEFTSKKDGNLKITQKQHDNISSIMTQLSIHGNPSLEKEEEKIFIEVKEEDMTEDAMNFSADVFFVDDSTVFAVEMKSVKPNSGEMRGEKHKILEGKAALFNKYPGKKIEFFVGFPFDPTANPDEPTCYDKERFFSSIVNMHKSFAYNETLLAAELWDKLSGQKNTMEEILQIINDIATPSFMDEFSYICDIEDKNDKDYRAILEKWHIYSEVQLCDYNDQLFKNVSQDKKLLRLYNQEAFDPKGNYKQDRYFELCQLIP